MCTYLRTLQRLSGCVHIFAPPPPPQSAEYEAVQRLIRVDRTMVEMDAAMWLVGELGLGGHPAAIRAAAIYLQQAGASFAAYRKECGDMLMRGPTSSVMLPGLGVGGPLNKAASGDGGAGGAAGASSKASRKAKDRERDVPRIAGSASVDVESDMPLPPLPAETGDTVLRLQVVVRARLLLLPLCRVLRRAGLWIWPACGLAGCPSRCVLRCGCWSVVCPPALTRYWRLASTPCRRCA